MIEIDVENIIDHPDTEEEAQVITATAATDFFFDIYFI